MTLAELYDIALQEKIKLHRINLKDLNGLYIENNIIINSNIKDEYTEMIALAEELGHYFSGVTPSLPFSTDYYTKLVRSKNEYKAKKWLINEIIPFDKFKGFLEQNMDKFDIAENFGVDASLVEDAFELYEPDLKLINKFD